VCGAVCLVTSISLLWSVLIVVLPSTPAKSEENECLLETLVDSCALIISVGEGPCFEPATAFSTSPPCRRSVIDLLM
jgi:hypothetical protein